ncbi:hypothetical protein F53441_6879 [Fusarium austroafricanum]|uniref:NmrA-like domain-containing protein n=1 Tax=Fusarium austroafricanum TaxID=2364996 RepID=A0A8H4KGX3_9HYPO|nr:hypothetical protein F53441_6879 [Fusarium austroafricanum]
MEEVVYCNVEYLIFSTLPDVARLSGGKYTKAHPFDSKSRAEAYIQPLPIKKAFFCPATFMENILKVPYWAPQKTKDGIWETAMHLSPQTRIPWIDITGGTGKFVGSILANPNKYEGKTFHAAVGHYTLEELVAIKSELTGINISYQKISAAEFKERAPYLPGVFIEGFTFYEEFGYFGPDADNLVAWALENARGQPTSLEDFLQAHSFKLE